MVVAGKLLSEDVFSVLLKQSGDIQKDFEKMPLTLDRASNRVALNFDRVLDAINDSSGATAALADLINDVALSLGDAADYISSGSLDADFSTWSDFADDIGNVVDNLETLLEWFDLLDRVGVGFNDVLLDFPVWAKAAFDEIIAHAEYSVEWIVSQYKILDLELGKVWVSVKSSFYGAFNDIRVFSMEVAQDIINGYSDVLKDLSKIAAKAGQTDVATKLLVAGSNARTAAYNLVSDAQDKAAKSAGFYAKQTRLNNIEILKENAALAAAAVARDQVILNSNKAVVAVKLEREAEKQRTIEMNEAEKQFRALDKAYKKATESSKKNTKATGDNAKAVKAAARAKEKAAKIVEKYNNLVAGENVSLDKQILLVGKNEIAAYKLGLQQKKIIGQDLISLVNKKKLLIQLEKEAGITNNRLSDEKALKKSRDDFFKSENKLNLERKLGFKLIKGLTQEESKLADIRDKARRVTDAYTNELQSLNEKLEYQNILNYKGADAARLHTLEIKYGSNARADAVFAIERQIDASQKETLMYGKLEDALGSYIKTGLEGFIDLGNQVDNFTNSIFNLLKGQGSLGDIGDAFSNMLTPFEGTGFSDLIGNAMNTASLVGSIGGSKSAQYGSVIGTGIGMLIPIPGAGLIGAVIGELFKDVDKYRADLSSGTNVKYQDNSKTTSEFGTFGFSNIDIKNLKESGQYEGAQKVLKSIKAIDDTFASFLPETDIKRIQKGLEGFSGSGLDEKLLKDRIDIIVGNMNAEMAALIDLDQPLEVITTRINDMSLALNQGAPLLQDLGFNLGQTDAKLISATLGLSGFSGGLDGLIGLTDNYVNKLFSESEQLLIGQGKAAQGIAALAQEMGIAANDLDTGAELRAQIEYLNQSGKLQTEIGQKQLVDLLKQVDNVSILEKAGISASAALDSVPEGLQNVIGGISTLDNELIASADNVSYLTQELEDLSNVRFGSQDAQEKERTNSLLEELIKKTQEQADEIVKLREITDKNLGDINENTAETAGSSVRQLVEASNG